MTPTEDQALAALRTIVAYLAGAAVAGAERETYDADRLPPGVTRDGYLRRHRERVRARATGWTRVGQARVVTRAAWSAEVDGETRRTRRAPVQVAPAPSGVDEVARALGIRLVGGGR